MPRICPRWPRSIASRSLPASAASRTRCPTPPSSAAASTAVREAGLPAYVAVDGDGRVLGFCWARPFRPIAAYSRTVEDSIHVASDARRHGVGRALLEALIAACGKLGCRQMIAVVGDARNLASIRLHESLGFKAVGFLPARERSRPARWMLSCCSGRFLLATRNRRRCSAVDLGQPDAQLRRRPRSSPRPVDPAALLVIAGSERRWRWVAHQAAAPIPSLVDGP